MPRVNLLIADDVGLGKTVEAGLILKELLLRRRIRRVLVLVPAALRLQWRDELDTKFALPVAWTSGAPRGSPFLAVGHCTSAPRRSRWPESAQD